MKRRDLLANLGTLGTLGIGRALVPGWVPQLAFRSTETVSAAPGDTFSLHLFTRRYGRPERRGALRGGREPLRRSGDAARPRTGQRGGYSPRLWTASSDYTRP